MKVGAIVQARTGSSRLPGKVLLKLPYGSEKTVLEQVLERLKSAKTLDEIVVATTEKEEDKPILEIAERLGVKTFRGSEKDVLSRYYLAAKHYGIDIVVRITSDCPCIDPKIVDQTVEYHLKVEADYTRNEGFPRGLDVEVVNFSALEIAYCNAERDFEREHVCPYIYSTAKDRFKLAYYKAPEHLRTPDIRITLDTEEDYALLCCVFDKLYFENPLFSAEEIIELFEEKPYLSLINRRVRQKRTFFNLEEELKEAVKVLELQELKRAKELLEKELKRIR